MGVGQDTFNIRIHGLEELSGAGDSTSSGPAGHKVGHLSLGLHPDLGSHGPIVSFRIVQIFILVHVEPALILLGQSDGHVHVAVGVVLRNS